MKILESQSATLSNHEVLAHIVSSRSKPRTTPLKSQNLETVIKELQEYLSPRSLDTSPLPPYNQIPYYTSDSIRTLVARLEPYKLTKAELLTILNLRPQELGLLDCVVEECDLRISEEEQEDVLRIIAETLGKDEGGGEGGADGNGLNGVNGDKMG